METGFYMVWNEVGSSPRVRHDNLDDAKKEASRLASAQPGVRFFVLQAIGQCQSVNTVYTRLEEPIPF